MTTEEEAVRRAWQEWHQQRLDVVRAPYGPLSVTGTHWLAGADAEGRLADVPGRWFPSGDGVRVHADILEGLVHRGEPLVGGVLLVPDADDPAATRLAHGERRWELLRREGEWAVRVHDPDAAARRAFSGVRTTPFDPRWALRGTFRPYGERRTVRVANADGRERGLELAGSVEFVLPGGGSAGLRVSSVGSGALWAVFADATSGGTSCRFRFLRTGVPAGDGGVTVDFNRSTLPPCAFSDHFLCPFPPPGNTLGVPVPAGERDVA
ncbi:DUF1684 domain-containing protein [Streptomyces sp. P38-E01]|uniref:DUF1684 domain-containing protein n=1 Tax=Streptomyces tardus TaxID=2780544 RepID=A0A949JP75_9ACTN|nr:DUF1684 domain-containing protein [Streptomyces tardus]MBU7599799.1 DUF1684 domain-containing protein [Streptomyces tardus]